MVLDTGIIRVFHSPVLIEDLSGTLPVLVIVVLLSDNIQGQIFITTSSLVFKHVTLVLLESSAGTRLDATKTCLVVTHLFDDTSAHVNLAGLN